MKTVIVTGAGGFIGKALTKKLLSQNTVVYAIVRKKEKLKDIINPNLIIIESDINDYESIEKTIVDEIDIVYHFAWDGVVGNGNNNSKVQLNNINISTELLKWAISKKIKKFVFAGSSYQHKVDYIYKNGEEKRNINIYGLAKEATEQIGRAITASEKIEFISVLFTNVFGVGDYSKRSTNQMLKTLLSGNDLNLIEGNNLHDWTYIDDAIDGIIAASLKGKDGIAYYVGLRKLKTFREILVIVGDTIDPSKKLNFGSYDDKSYIDYSKIDLDALYNDTGFECKADFKESILKTAQWVKTLKW